MRTTHPSGTVTLLLSDIVASTQRWSDGSVAAERDVARLHDVIAGAVGSAGGVLVKARGEGDSHFAAFDRPSAAIAAAASIQRSCTAVAEAPPVRIAVTMGEMCARDGDYVGSVVNRSARIRSAAHGGQVICTRPVVDVGMPVAGLSAKSLGSYRIRDVGDEVELFQLCGEGIPSSFPPLSTLDTAATAVMTIVIVDEVGSRFRANAVDLPSWQGPLYRAFRQAAASHDGRFLRLLGDGCVAAFEDPRQAVAFANQLCGLDDFRLRAGVAAGLVDVVEGELTGVAFYEAGVASKGASEREVVLTPLVRALLGEE
jgi:class 3 adenylate cyclase